MDDDEEEEDFPPFGDSQSDYDTVSSCFEAPHALVTIKTSEEVCYEADVRHQCPSPRSR